MIKIIILNNLFWIYVTYKISKKYLLTIKKNNALYETGKAEMKRADDWRDKYYLVKKEKEKK